MKCILETGLTDEQFLTLSNKTRRDIFETIYEVPMSPRNMAEQLGGSVYTSMSMGAGRHEEAEKTLGAVFTCPSPPPSQSSVLSGDRAGSEGCAALHPPPAAGA